MKKYRVLRDCHWNYGYWEEGQKVEFSDELKPPRHFQLVDRFGDDIIESVKPEPNTFSGINKARSESMPKTGMSAKSKSPVSHPSAI